MLDDPQVGEGVALVHREALVQPEGGRLISIVWNVVGSQKFKKEVSKHGKFEILLV